MRLLQMCTRPLASGSGQPRLGTRGNAHSCPPVVPACIGMSLLGNIIWLIFGGLISGLAWIVAGLGLCITIVGIPFGLQAIKIGFASLTPFGKDVREQPDANSALRIVFNLIWIFLFGWELAIAHVIWACLLGITIVGLPFAKQHIKLVPLALMPFGRTLR